MQKKLIVLALASAFAAPAFAATSNVDIYGQFDVSVDYTSGLRTTGATPLQKDHGYRLSSNASRIGFKGSEDLGGGLAAIWQFEQGLNLDAGNGSGGDGKGNGAGFGNLRNTFLGLKGGFGTVLGGTHDTPYKLSTASLDPFADTAGDYNAFIGSFDGFNTSDLRLGNVLAYITPNFSGFTAAIATSFLKESGLNNTNGAPSAWTGMVNYANGPLYLAAAYETAKHIGATAADIDLRSWKLGGGYTFGNFTVNAIYEDIKATVNTGSFGTTPALIFTGQDAKRKAYGLNGVYNMGNIALKAGYYHASKIDTSAGSVNDSAAKMYELGADYNLSKRTKAYLVYTKVKDDTAASYCAGGSNSAGFGSSGVNIVCGDDPSILALGMRHTF